MRTIKFRGWFCDIGTQNVTDIETSCILMQFTGLLDKNGKEIYESDDSNNGWQIVQPEEKEEVSSITAKCPKCGIGMTFTHLTTPS